MNLREAAEKSLEALERTPSSQYYLSRVSDAKNFLLDALAEPEPEPVAWRMRDTGFKKAHYCYYDTKAQAEAYAAQVLQSRDDGHLTDLTPLYTRTQP